MLFRLVKIKLFQYCYFGKIVLYFFLICANIYCNKIIYRVFL